MSLVCGLGRLPYSSERKRVGHPLNPEAVSSEARRGAVLIRKLNHGFERFRYHVVEASVQLFLGPVVARAVLHPLEVRGSNAAGVGKDVGHHEDSRFLEYRVGFRCRWPIGPLNDYFPLYLVRFFFFYLIL